MNLKESLRQMIKARMEGMISTRAYLGGRLFTGVVTAYCIQLIEFDCSAERPYRRLIILFSSRLLCFSFCFARLIYCSIPM